MHLLLNLYYQSDTPNTYVMHNIYIHLLSIYIHNLCIYMYISYIYTYNKTIYFFLHSISSTNTLHLHYAFAFENIQTDTYIIYHIPHAV